MDNDSIDKVEIYHNSTQNEFTREKNMEVLSRHVL